MSTKKPLAAALSLDAFSGMEARAGFEVAAGAGYRGIAFGTNHPELNPEALGPSARRHLKTLLAGKGLAVTSLRPAGPRGGLADSKTIDRTLDNARKAISLARELGVGTVTVNVGALGTDGENVTAGMVVSALRELAQQADAAGLKLALGADQVGALATVLKQVDFEGARANLDGARLIGGGEDVLKVAEAFGGMGVGQFTAADAVRSGKAVRAVMLGEGQLPMVELMEILEEQGFNGPLVVDVRDLPDGVAGAEHAAEVLRRLWRSA